MMTKEELTELLKKADIIKNELQTRIEEFQKNHPGVDLIIEENKDDQSLE